MTDPCKNVLVSILYNDRYMIHLFTLEIEGSKNAENCYIYIEDLNLKRLIMFKTLICANAHKIHTQHLTLRKQVRVKAERALKEGIKADRILRGPYWTLFR